ncbi:MAG TPA: hypothetical protein PLP17_01510 [Oligoflexia bacterium]|nr:hypothetical protein [Oligoflexia bacterium]
MDSHDSTVWRPPEEIQGFVFDASTLFGEKSGIAVSVPHMAELLEAAAARYGRKTVIVKSLRMLGTDVASALARSGIDVLISEPDPEWGLSTQDALEVMLHTAPEMLGLAPCAVGLLTDSRPTAAIALHCGYGAVAALASGTTIELWQKCLNRGRPVCCRANGQPPCAERARLTVVLKPQAIAF